MSLSFSQVFVLFFRNFIKALGEFSNAQDSFLTHYDGTGGNPACYLQVIRSDS